MGTPPHYFTSNSPWRVRSLQTYPAAPTQCMPQYCVPITRLTSAPNCPRLLTGRLLLPEKLTRGANATIVELRGDEDTSSVFSSAKCLLTWGFGGAPPGNFFIFSTSETVSGGFWNPAFSNIHWVPSLRRLLRLEKPEKLIGRLLRLEMYCVQNDA
jgi:hypothetical protein